MKTSYLPVFTRVQINSRRAQLRQTASIPPDPSALNGVLCALLVCLLKVKPIYSSCVLTEGWNPQFYSTTLVWLQGACFSNKKLNSPIASGLYSLFAEVAHLSLPVCRDSILTVRPLCLWAGLYSRAEVSQHQDCGRCSPVLQVQISSSKWGA